MPQYLKAIGSEGEAIISLTCLVLPHLHELRSQPSLRPIASHPSSHPDNNRGGRQAVERGGLETLNTKFFIGIVELLLFIAHVIL